MGLFSRKVDTNLKRAKAFIQPALETSSEDKPRDLSEAVVYGATMRRRFCELIDYANAKLGESVIGTGTAEGKLFVHSQLEDVIRKRPDAAFDDVLVLKVGLDCCIITKDARRRLNEEWPSMVAQYRGKDNTDALLREKAIALARYVVVNLDYAEMAEGEISDEQNNIVRVEEVSVWYRLLDELAFNILRRQRDVFVDFLLDNLATNLALEGIPPKLIYDIMAARSQEYGGYRHWVAPPNGATKGTVLWEAAKHVAVQIGFQGDVIFQLAFSRRFAEKLKRASVRELLVGKANP